MKKQIITPILEKLQELGSPERAAWDKAYHKSNRTHFGVPAPESAKIAKTLAKEHTETDLLQLSRSLWETNLFDSMILAGKILAQPKINPGIELWETITKFLKDVDGWGLEDNLAHAAWKNLLHDGQLLDHVETWTHHKNFWVRRAALVYTLPFAKPGQNPDRMLSWAAFYAVDSEWFIQKAIGWWLRVLGAHNPERVITFLTQHGKQLKSVARKEATRKLPVDWKMQAEKALK